MTDKQVLRAKPIALRLILAGKNNDGEGAEHTLADVEKILRDDPATYVILCSAIAHYAASALSALDKHFGDDWGGRLLDAWLVDALDKEAALDD
ncbi:MAG: hypothetical protein WAN02_28555 [Mycobacterium sp.]